MKTRISIAIMWIIWARLASNEAAPANSGERVHIRLHMPEVVRKHTHFHKVYKQLPIPVPYHQQPPPGQHHHHQQHLQVGKPHVSLLGYTTTASGSGGMSPSLMQLMATAVAPTMAPQYGPALFDSYTKQAQQQGQEDAMLAMKPSGSSSYLATAPGSSSSNKQQQQQLLQQLFTPNLMAAIKAAQLLDRKKEERDTEMDEPQPELELEHNELLNGNFLAALQREYISKFVKPGRSKRKKINFGSSSKRPQMQTKYVQEQDDDDDETDNDYQEEQPGTGYAELEEQPESYAMQTNTWPDHHEQNYDSAMAFSGQNNELTAVPSVDEFLHEVNNGKSYAPFEGNMYDDYGATGGSSWQALSTQPRPTKTTPTRVLRKRRPSLDMITGYGGTGNPGKVRYIKLTTRKKRKNRIKTKRYRI